MRLPRFILGLCLTFSAYFSQAQVAPAATYLLFSIQHMDILDYRMAYSGSPTAYYAYTLRNNANDFYVLYTGSSVYADYLPTNTQSSDGFKLQDDLYTGVNNVTRQMFVVHQQQKGFLVFPIVSITKISTSNKYTVVNAPNYSFILDTENLMMGRELSTAGSKSSVVLNAYGYQTCKNQYTFKRKANTQGAEEAEFDYIPGVGIVAERSGRTAAEMQTNQITLWGVNGLPLSDYINKVCGVTATNPAPPAPPASTTTAPSGPRLGEPATGDPVPASVTPTTTAAPGTVMISAISNHPVVQCNVVASPGYHVVQPKETVNSIARYYGVTAAQVIKWNNIKDPNKITVCQQLRVAAPGTTPAATQTAVKGVSNTANSGYIAPAIITAPPAPAPATNYQPVQPSTQTAVPDLFAPSGNQPITHSNTLQPTVPAPINTPAVVTMPGQQGQYYAVQPGEGVHAIAKKFGYTEERFRTMNNFASTGNVPLQVGQLVKVSDCEHAPVSTYYNPVPVIPAVSTDPKVRTSATTVQQPALQPGVQPTLTPVMSSNNQPVLTQPTGATQPGFVPINTPQVTPPVLTTPNEAQQQVTKRQPIGFRDYFVRDAETLQDIARKEKVDAAELGVINGRDTKEVLPPGTRLQIPIY